MKKDIGKPGLLVALYADYEYPANIWTSETGTLLPPNSFSSE